MKIVHSELFLKSRAAVVLGHIKITNPATSSHHGVPQPSEQVHLTDFLSDCDLMLRNWQKTFAVPMGALVWVPADISWSK